MKVGHSREFSTCLVLLSTKQKPLSRQPLLSSSTSFVNLPALNLRRRPSFKLKPTLTDSLLLLPFLFHFTRIITEKPIRQIEDDILPETSHLLNPYVLERLDPNNLSRHRLPSFHHARLNPQKQRFSRALSPPLDPRIGRLVRDADLADIQMHVTTTGRGESVS